jgi:hypothetical protein
VCGLVAAVLHFGWAPVLVTGSRFALAGLGAGALTGALYGLYQADRPASGTQPHRTAARAQRPADDRASQQLSGNGVPR